ncbi:MAG: Mov34/MPN/PAD-1 family protein [Candidatus Cybelea sp.]
MTITLPFEAAERMREALERAGAAEIGGILMGEHVGEDAFFISNMTIEGGGTVATFVRHVRRAIGALRVFFAKTNHRYKTHNYLGEWHSHPSFRPEPSAKDAASMHEIVTDPTVGANFVVLVIVKLTADRKVDGTATVFLPSGSVFKGNLAIETAVTI